MSFGTASSWDVAQLLICCVLGRSKHTLSFVRSVIPDSRCVQYSSPLSLSPSLVPYRPRPSPSSLLCSHETQHQERRRTLITKISTRALHFSFSLPGLLCHPVLDNISHKYAGWSILRSRCSGRHFSLSAIGRVKRGFAAQDGHMRMFGMGARRAAPPPAQSRPVSWFVGCRNAES